jgi:hypothetical protein
VLSKISTEVISTVKNNPVKSGLGIFAALAALYFLTSGKK